MTRSGIDTSELDPAVRPADDLFLHVNGRWWATHEIPPDRAIDGSFRALNDELKKNGPMRPSLVIDLDRLDHNIDLVKASVARVPNRHYRIVEKSIPCAGLIDYVAKRAGTNRLMSFHQPFLNIDAQTRPDSDLLVGKPLVPSADQLVA